MRRTYPHGDYPFKLDGRRAHVDPRLSTRCFFTHTAQWGVGRGKFRDQVLAFRLCSRLSRTQPVTPRRPPNCFEDSTSPVIASTITLVCVFILFGMMSIAY